MPKNSSYELFCRWRALDAHLRAGSLHVPDFCARWRVSAKRVYADLRLFRGLGQSISKERDFGRGWTWAYLGSRPLFRENLRHGMHWFPPPSIRDRPRA
jgi:hypothetical protein